jgi:hypothetical protein
MSDPLDWNAKTIAEFRANQGRVGGPFEGAPLVLAHHRGRKGGRQYVTPMMYLPHDLPRVCPGAPGHPRGGRGERLGRGESPSRHRHRARGAPVVAKYTGVLAAADIEVFTTTTTTFQIMQSRPRAQRTGPPLTATRRGRASAGPGAGLGICALG